MELIKFYKVTRVEYSEYASTPYEYSNRHRPLHDV